MKMQNSTITISDINKAINRLPNPSQILAEKSASVAIFHKIGKQPDIFAVSQNYKDALSAMTLSVSDPFFDDYLEHINKFQLIRNATTAREFGYTVLEVTEYGNYKGKIVPLKIELCPPEKFFFDSNRQLRLATKNNLEGILVHELYPNKFICIQNEPCIDNPYGTALLDISYWLGVGLNGNFEFMLNFAEEDGRDKWIGTYQPGATELEKQELLEALATLRGNGIAIMPENMSAAPKDYKNRTASADLYKNINEICLRKVEKLWYGTDLTMQVQGKGGYSSSQSGIEIREDALAQGRTLAIDAINQLIKIVAAINSMNVDGIHVSLFSPRQTTKEEAETDKIYFDMGLKPTAKFFENRGYNPDEFEYSLHADPKLNQQFSDTSLADIFDIFKSDLNSKNS